MQSDLSGLLFVEQLLAAADRGVRVRLLIDDLDTIGDDDEIAALEFLTDLEGVDHRMHNKSFVVTIDRRHVFVGSFNWDPRSGFLNTEIGLFIDSPALGEWAAETFAKRLPEHSYRVRITADDELERVEKTADGERVWDEEPETGVWRRFQADFLGIVPEGRL